MYPSMKAELAARDGDLRLCLLLGIATWFLFLDHIPHNVVSLLTMRNFGFSGAVDLFVFIGGYTAAIPSSRQSRRSPSRAASSAFIDEYIVG